MYGRPGSRRLPATGPQRGDGAILGLVREVRVGRKPLIRRHLPGKARTSYRPLESAYRRLRTSRLPCITRVRSPHSRGSSLQRGRLTMHRRGVKYALALAALAAPLVVYTASHREAPITALDRPADITDWYTFVSYND